ncbi:hypothetical protein DSECCO2_546400 [anaerobic digester metagenome]
MLEEPCLLIRPHVVGSIRSERDADQAAAAFFEGHEIEHGKALAEIAGIAEFLHDGGDAVQRIRLKQGGALHHHQVRGAVGRSFIARRGLHLGACHKMAAEGACIEHHGFRYMLFDDSRALLRSVLIRTSPIGHPFACFIHQGVVICIEVQK